MGQTAAIILASLVLLSQYSLYGALDAGFRKDFADWDNDIVVVVTWYNKDITWLQVFPEPITFAILVKGAINSCATIPKEIKNRVDSCRELPNSDGREAHSMAWFMYTFYDTLPRLSVFTQDDCVTGHQCTILSLALMSLSEREELVESAEDKPFADENCLCDSITEPNFVQCPKGQYEGTEMNPCYGVRWHAIVELMRLFGVSDAREYTSLRWAGAAVFTAARDAVRSQPRSVYKIALALLNGVNDKAKEHGEMGVGRDTQTASLRLRLISENHTRDWQSSSHAHTFERMWFWLLDPIGYRATLEPGLKRRSLVKSGQLDKKDDPKYRWAWHELQDEVKEEMRLQEEEKKG